MELEKHLTSQAYIQLLIDTQKKKLDVLNQLKEKAEEQEKIINENFDEDYFLQIISEKENLILILTELDDGFEQIYERVKEELKENKFRFETEIVTLKNYITSITDISVKLQALELRNKNKFDHILTQKRREIMKSKVSTQTAVKYYKTMTNQQEPQSYFYDKKK